MRRFIVIMIVLAVASSACTAVEHVGRPPSAAEIVRINAAVERGHSVLIETTAGTFDDPMLRPRCAGGGCGTPVQPLPPCAGGACGPASPRAARPKRDVPRTIAFVDSQKITFDTKLGGQVSLPFETVKSVKISSADRSLGAFIGVGIGAALDVGFAALLVALSRGGGVGDSDSGQSRGCDSSCAGAIGVLMLPALIGGAIAGAAIGVPHRFIFGDGATAP
jgi:hypothetical protein